MNDLEKLAEIDWWYVFIAVVLLLLGVKLIWSLVDWFLFDKLKIETGKMKRQREDRELLMTTTELAKTTAGPEFPFIMLFFVFFYGVFYVSMLGSVIKNNAAYKYFKEHPEELEISSISY